MKTRFWKMHGAGNDFILIDDRREQFPVGDAALIRRLCARHTGIGSEGLILIRAARGADFGMFFFNPDGSEGEMCGNGARCAARLAHDLKIAPAAMSIATKAGMLRAESDGERICVRMPPPTGWRMNLPLQAGNWKGVCHFVDTGVPHAVIEIKDIASVEIGVIGPAVRYHPAFAPRGANADFMAVTAGNALSARTYERGVEAETPACGTGIVACALVAGRLGRVKPPVRVSSAFGEVLDVNYRLSSAGAGDVTLTGSAVRVFSGEIDLPLTGNAANGKR